MAAAAGIEEGQRLHATYDNEFYPAVVTAVWPHLAAKNRSKKLVKVQFDGWDDEVWVSIDDIKCKKLGLKGEASAAKAEAPKAKAKAKVKAKAKAKAKFVAKKEGEESKKRDPVKFTYFGLWARGPSIALALEHSGIDWVGEFPETWKEMKPTTPWLELPVLEIPGIGTIGHEAAILNYVGWRSKKMLGFGLADYLTSQQLVAEAEDIYKKLGQIKNGQLSEDEVKAFWNDEDPTTHNKNFGIKVYFGLIDKFYTKCNAGEGKFTKSGITVGECKMFTMLHACKMMKDDCFDNNAGVKAFYDHFSKLEKTQLVMNGTGKMPGEFKKYFGA